MSELLLCEDRFVNGTRHFLHSVSGSIHRMKKLGVLHRLLLKHRCQIPVKLLSVVLFGLLCETELRKKHINTFLLSGTSKEK